MTATGGCSETSAIPTDATSAARVSTAARVPGGTRRCGPPVSRARPTPASTANNAEARPEKAMYDALTRPLPSSPGITWTVIIVSRATPRATSTPSTRRPARGCRAAVAVGGTAGGCGGWLILRRSRGPADGPYDGCDRCRDDEHHEERSSQEQRDDGSCDTGQAGVQDEGRSGRRHGLDADERGEQRDR